MTVLMYWVLKRLWKTIVYRIENHQGKTAQQRYKSLFKARSKVDLEEYYNRLAEQTDKGLGQPNDYNTPQGLPWSAVSPVYLSDIQVSMYQTSMRQHMQQRFCTYRVMWHWTLAYLGFQKGGQSPHLPFPLLSPPFPSTSLRPLLLPSLPFPSL